MTGKPRSTRQWVGAGLYAAGFLAIQAYIVSKNGWLWTVSTLAVAAAFAGGYYLMGDRKP
jgi:hypothetical protein